MQKCRYRSNVPRENRQSCAVLDWEFATSTTACGAVDYWARRYWQIVKILIYYWQKLRTAANFISWDRILCKMSICDYETAFSALSRFCTIEGTGWLGLVALPSYLIPMPGWDACWTEGRGDMYVAWFHGQSSRCSRQTDVINCW